MSDIYNLNPEPTPEPPLPKRTRSAFLVPLLVVLAVLVIAAAVVVVDPFQWNVVGNVKALLGLGGDPVMASMPTRTSVFMGVDLLNATPDKLNRLYKPFAIALDAGSSDTNTGVKDLDTQLQESLGLTLTDDIMPWIGKTAGLGMTDLKLSTSGPTDASLLFSVSSRDNKKADEFIQKLKAGIEKSSGEILTLNTYQGVTIYTLKPGSSSSTGQGISFGRSGDAVLFSNKESGVMDAVDAQKGDSLSRDKSFQALMDQLPKDRSISMYFPAQQIKDMLLALLESTPSSAFNGMTPDQVTKLITDQYAKISGMAASLTIVEAGLQVDSVASYYPDKMTAQDKSGVQLGKTALKAIDLLPAETLFFAGGNTLKESWTNLRDVLIQNSGITQSEYDQSMAELEKQININPEKDIFPYLGGNVVVAIAPSTKGLLPEQAKVNLGLAALVETSDSAKMMTTVDNVSSVIGMQLLDAPLEVKTAGDLKYYGVADPTSESEIFALGVGKQYLVAGTSGDLLEGLFSGKAGISSSSRYQSALKALPGGAVPFLYMDLEGILGKIRTGLTDSDLTSFDESVKSLKPIPMIIAGNSVLSDTMIKVTLVVFITPAK